MPKNSKRYYTMAYEPGDATAEIYIFGDITSWEWLDSDVSSYSLVKQIRDLPESVSITVHINSNGGEVKEGLGIYNALKGRNVTTICDGFAASAASVIFCAGKTRIMQPASLLFIHQALVATVGNADELEKEAQDLRKITESVTNAYKEAGVTLDDDKLMELMKAETWLTPDEAITYGFATMISGEEDDGEVKNDAMRSIMSLIEQVKAEAEPDEDEDPDEEDPEEDPEDPDEDPDEEDPDEEDPDKDDEEDPEDSNRELINKITKFTAAVEELTQLLNDKNATDLTPSPAQVEHTGFFGF